MVGICLVGGLGNQLFQLAAFSKFVRASKLEQIPFVHVRQNAHSSKNYFAKDSIFGNFEYQISTCSCNLSCDDYLYNDFLRGYFQHFEYVEQSFVQKLQLFENETHKLEGAFLHVRGGDFIYNSTNLHNVDLRRYYAEAILLFPPFTKFFIFTNDREYAQSFFENKNDNQYVFVKEDDEVKALTMMSQCTMGGICANSTFSWWGAYLNSQKNPNARIVLPNKWSNDPNIMKADGYFFPFNGMMVVSV